MYDATSEIEYAMIKHHDGTAVSRSAAQRSMMNALIAQGGKVGPDGRPMQRTAQGDWVLRAARDESPTRRAGSPLAELIRRQTFLDHLIHQGRLDKEIRADDPLLRGASPLAWLYARQFRRGFLPQPPLDASADELTGWRLARRGYDSPPAWLLQERRNARRRR